MWIAMHNDRIAWLGAMLCAGMGPLMPGCGGDLQCEPALSTEQTPVTEADLPAVWTSAQVASFRIVAATGPYRVSEAALDSLRAVMSEQAGLAVSVEDGTDTLLPGKGEVDHRDVVAAGQAQVPPGEDAVLVIVVVEATDYSDATYGFIEWSAGRRPVAVMGLHKGALGGILGGLISAETMETATVVHEVGHWLGVPARAFHTSAIDNSHCTNARCVMFKGSRVGPCAVLANISTGVPLRFGPDCAAELAEMQQRRQAAR